MRHEPPDAAGAPFSVRLRTLRVEAGLTQEELADRAGLTSHAVSALERGVRSRPYPHTVRSLADALGLDADARAGLIASVRGRSGGRPPARGGARSVAHQLAVPDTGLFGRDADVDAVRSLIAAGRRLVTLTGTGGVGKTRLAAAVAEQVRSGFPDGVAAVPLAAARSTDEVLPAIARALGAQTAPGDDLQADLVELLGPRRALLVLDNVEHVLEAAPAVAALVAACPGIVVLATSRAPLRVRAETEHSVAPLPVAAPGHGQAPSPAVALLVERARAVSPSFAVEPGDEAVLEQICRRLAGIPLALELAAARARALSAQALLERLDEACPTPSRDLPARQRTMRATVDWSYGLLHEQEQRLFRHLSVFPDSFDLAAAEAVGASACAGSATLPALEALIEHHLVVVQPDGRFRMLQPIGQHGRSLLDATSRARATEAHARHFLAFARQAHAAFAQSDQLEWLARAELEDDNLLLAVESAIGAGDARTAARLCWELQRFWWFRQRVEPGLRLCEQALDLCARTPEDRESVAMASLAAGAMSLALDRRDAAAGHWTRALRRASAVTDVDVAAHARAGLGLVALTGGDVDGALEHLREARSRAAAFPAGEEWLHGMCRIWEGSARSAAGDPVGARDAVEDGLAEARGRGDRMAAYMALYALSHGAFAAGDVDQARRHLVEGLRLAGETRDVTNVAHFAQTLVVIEATAGDARRAVVLSSAAAELLAAAGAAGASYRLLDASSLTSAVADASSRLAPDAAQAAVRTGRAMDLDQLVAYVLAGAVRLRAVHDHRVPV